jgi:hypothetical protein
VTSFSPLSTIASHHIEEHPIAAAIAIVGEDQVKMGSRVPMQRKEEEVMIIMTMPGAGKDKENYDLLSLERTKQP